MQSRAPKSGNRSRNQSRNPRLDWIAKVLADPPPPSREERVSLRLVAEGTPTPGRRGHRPLLVAAPERGDR